MSLDESQVAELEKIVREVQAGRRIIMFPPGSQLFAASNVLLSLAFIVAYLSLLALVSESVIEVTKTKALLQLLGVVLVFPVVVVPGLLALRGVNTVRWYQSLSAGAAMVCMGVLIGNEVMGSGEQTIPLLLASVLSAISMLIGKKTSFMVFFYYCYLLKRK